MSGPHCNICEDTGYDEVAEFLLPCKACQRGYNVETEGMKALLKSLETRARKLRKELKTREVKP